VHSSLFKGVVFEESGVQVLYLVVDLLLLLRLKYRSGTFHVLVFFFRVLRYCRG
jgi:hypothetical protein